MFNVTCDDAVYSVRKAQLQWLTSKRLVGENPQYPRFRGSMDQLLAKLQDADLSNWKDEDYVEYVPDFDPGCPILCNGGWLIYLTEAQFKAVVDYWDRARPMTLKVHRASGQKYLYCGASPKGLLMLAGRLTGTTLPTFEELQELPDTPIDTVEAAGSMERKVDALCSAFEDLFTGLKEAQPDLWKHLSTKIGRD